MGNTRRAQDGAGCGVAERIRAAALELFRAKGLIAATMAEIAERAGCSVGTLYLHFSGKQDLYQALGRPELPEGLEGRGTARRRQVLEAALAVFGEKGYGAATMEDVAARVGLSKAALYEYFESKEDLFIAVVRQDLGRSAGPCCPLEGLFDAKLAAATYNEPAELLRAIARHYAEVHRDPARSTILRLILAEAVHDPEFVTMFRTRVTGDNAERVTQALLAMGCGPEAEVRGAAGLFLGVCFAWMFHTVVLRSVPPSFKPGAEGSPDLAEEFGRTAVDLVLNGSRALRREQAGQAPRRPRSRRQTPNRSKP
jgi:AcrR family transcriptional regulator